MIYDSNLIISYNNPKMYGKLYRNLKASLEYLI